MTCLEKLNFIYTNVFYHLSLWSNFPINVRTFAKLLFFWNSLKGIKTSILWLKIWWLNFAFRLLLCQLINFRTRLDKVLILNILTTFPWVANSVQVHVVKQRDFHFPCTFKMTKNTLIQSCYIDLHTKIDSTLVISISFTLHVWC